MGKLDGKVAVITGATSGMALARQSCLSKRERTCSLRAGGKRIWMMRSKRLDGM